MRKLAYALAVLVMASCGDAGNGGTSQPANMPVHADLTGAKAVFVSSRSGLARQAVDDAALKDSLHTIVMQIKPLCVD